MHLVIVDAHSKWMDVCVMSKITASDTIFHLRSVFTSHGLPDTIVSDNGPTFTSQEFQDFMRYNNIHHIRTAPYHPSSYGLAKRAVETYKSSLPKMTRDTVHEKANRFLFKYCTTPHSTTGVTPAELM
ncbi:Pol polyprotein [Elysia marginata]|uniref:Pol polyprotein n=1 Tax=Elysia marginata TaxID=1093978 RepID=A0AAV4FQS8_9GAST|nr:Pol polyprotein [Elysia marginata]